MRIYQKKRLSGILGVTLASVTVLAVANAADMYPGPIPTGGVVDWAGFFIGANIGGAWGELNTTDIFGTCTPSACPFKNHFVVDTAKVGVNYFVSSIYEPLK